MNLNNFIKYFLIIIYLINWQGLFRIVCGLIAYIVY